MSFTDNHHGVVSIHQDALNIVIRTVANQRPRLFHYLSKISATTANATKLDPIPYPAVLPSGEPAVFHYELHVEKIEIDLFPEDIVSIPPQMKPFNENEMVLSAELKFVYYCSKQITIIPVKEDENRKNIPPPVVDIQEGEPEEVELKLLIKFAPTSEHSEDPENPGATLGMRCLAVEIVDIEPKKLENFLECYIKGIIEISVAPQLTFFVQNFTTNFFTVALTAGPFVKENRILIYGDVIPSPELE